MRQMMAVRKMLWLPLLFLSLGLPVCADLALVEDGRSRAQIVVAEQPPRRTRLAAQELQAYLERISGARLPIVEQPEPDYPVKVYVGQSAYTDALGLDVSNLRHGAFRMVAGVDWLALIGRDVDYQPNEPWGRNRRHGAGEVQTAWEEMSASYTLCPMRHIWRRRHRGRDEESLGWSHDIGGSYNAVTEFLRRLGVRWYMPGPLGEVVPELSSIALPSVDKIIKPDYPQRYWFGAFFAYEPEDIMWEWRLGMNSGYEVLGAGMHVHGMRLIHGHPKMQENHPEYYALIDGKRDTRTHGTGHACFSSEGLAREAAKFARAVFDLYDEPAVSLWPQDGLRNCRCELCAGKSASDLVWGFIDRVARDLYTTHPDRLITGGAYASYQRPPDSIERFSPNVALFISNVGRPVLDDDERWEAYWGMISAWKAKLGPGRIIRNENNRYSSGRPVPFPIMYPRAMARDLREMRGISLGDWNEQARSNFGQPGKTFWSAPGLDHLTLYVNARFLWDATQDVEALMDEYYRLFYGPAAEEMRAAFEFAQATYPRDQNHQPRPGRIALSQRVSFVEMLHHARTTAGDSVYGERIDLILSELQPLEDLRRDAEFAQKREGVPVYSRLLTLSSSKWGDAPATFELDGRITEPFWLCWNAGGTHLRDVVAGRSPEHATRFWTRWHKAAFCVGIRCDDDMSQLHVTTTRDQDLALLDGDYVEILIETDYHSHYRIAVNPAGTILDRDMEAPEGERIRWRSNADVAVHQGEDYWSVELRIPVVSEREGAMDPYHYVVGRPPSHVRSQAYPWHFNIGRVRVRDGQRRVSAFSPTGVDNFDDTFSFAQMYMRN